MSIDIFLCCTLSNILGLLNLSWSLCARDTFIPCSNTLTLFGIRVSLPIRPTSLKEFKKGLRELFLVLIMIRMQMLWMCVMLIVYEHSLKFVQSLPQCSRTSKLLPPCRGEIHGRKLRNNAKLAQPCARTNRYASSSIPYHVDLINSKLGTSLDFLLSFFLLCLPASQLGFVSLLSLTALFLVILVFFSPSLLLYFVIQPLGRDFVQIKSYRIIENYL